MLTSHIRISSALDETLTTLVNELESQNYKIIERDDFLIEDAHQLIGYAYIASDSVKTLIVKASSYNHVSQNALLKLLEEPPHNIVIVLIAPSKSLFLPTIRSRLPLIQVTYAKEIHDALFDFNTLSLKSIFSFFREHKRLGKEGMKMLLNEALQYYVRLPKRSTSLQREVLEMFEESYRLLALNSATQTILSRLFLTLLECSKK